MMFGVERVACCAMALWGFVMAESLWGQQQRIHWEMEEIDSEVAIGYGVAVGDVDGDGRLDILLADQRQFAWYENPTWTKHVLAENLTARDNVCLAARDINGDGRVEIAVGAEWNPGDTENSGAVFYLEPPEDRRQAWRAVKLHHEPVVHRMYWVNRGDKHVLVVSPLHGRGNSNGEGQGVRLLAYEPPSGVYKEGKSDGPWKLELMHDSFHVTHNLDVRASSQPGSAEEVFYLGREGAALIRYSDARWRGEKLDGVAGGGEIRVGKLSGERCILATIEPFHGDKLVVHYANRSGEGAGAEYSMTGRELLDDNIRQGHALAVGDLYGGDELDEVVVGWREANRDGDVGLKMYYREGGQWRWQWVDRGGMATEDARLGDFNGDGRLDIVASGRGTKNLRIYWNGGKAKETKADR